MNDDVVITRRWQVGVEFAPTFAAVVADVHGPLGTCKQDFRLAGKFGEAAHRGVVFGQTVDHCGPRFSEVRRLEYVWSEVAVTMSIERNVSGATRRRRRDDLTDERSIGHGFDTFAQ